MLYDFSPRWGGCFRLFDKLQFVELLSCSFLVPARKEPKEAVIGGGFSQSRPLLCTSPPKLIRPVEFIRIPQMFRFAVCRVDRLSSVRRGRGFLGGGRTCARERALAPSPKPISLVTFLFGNKKVTPKQLDKLEFINPILSGSKQTPHPVSLHDNPALYKKHSFLHSKAVYQV